jgi:hypothetical protein
MDETKKVFQTKQRIIEQNVETPIVVIDRDPRREEPAMCIQWFGEASTVRLPDGCQFYFDVLVDPNDIMWEDQQESFRVAFLGQVKNWDPPATAPVIAKMITKGDLEAYVALLSSPQVTIPETLMPATFAVPVVILVDGNVWIVPQEFKNITIMDDVMAEHDLKLADQEDNMYQYE